MKSVKSIQLNSNLDIISDESWNDYIPVKYEDIGLSNIELDEDDDEYADEIGIEISIKGTDIQKVVK